MRLFKDERIRDGIIVAVLAVAGAILIRVVRLTPDLHIHFEVLGQLTGIDFGTWPDIFYAGGGGDGEIFAVLAADPWGAGPSQLIPIVIYRFSRIGFSALAWALSLGHEEWVLPAMFVVGLLAVAGVGYQSGVLRHRIGARAWLLALNPALYFGFSGDTAEPLGLLFLTMAMAGSSIWAAAALGVTRPSYAVALPGRWRLLAGAAGAAVVVRVASVLLFEGSIMETADGAFGIPFVSYLTDPTIAGIMILAAAVTTVVIGARARNLAWLFSGMLVISLGEIVLQSPVNAIRAAGMLPVLWAFGPGERRVAADRGLNSEAASADVA